MGASLCGIAIIVCKGWLSVLNAPLRGDTSVPILAKPATCVSRAPVKPTPILLLVLVACDLESGLGRVNAPPTVEISAPIADELFRQGQSLLLVAAVGDDTDPVAELVVEWSIDSGEAHEIDASATGEVLVDLGSDTLALGVHQVTVGVTDKDGATTLDSVSFEVAGPLGVPTVEITAPDAGTLVSTGTSITFTGTASDTSTPADDLEMAWASDVDGALAGAISGDGQTILLYDALSAGSHMITLSATDLDGEVGSDSILVVVEDIPIEPEPGDLIFTEMMVNPNAVEDEYGEWVELYNTSGSTLDLAGYSFHDDGEDEWVFDRSVTVGPKSYLVICANTDADKNGGVPCDAWFYRQPMGESPPSGYGHGNGVAIANNDDELVLTSPYGLDIDVFDYNDTDSDPIQDGQGFGLDPTKLDGVLNDNVANWCTQTTPIGTGDDRGTPGIENDPCQ